MQNQNTLAYHHTEHLRMNGIYWGLTSLALMDRIDALPKPRMLNWVMSCWDAEIGRRVICPNPHAFQVLTTWSRPGGLQGASRPIPIMM